MTQPIEQLIDAHLNGAAVEVPEGVRAEFAQAVEADRALREVIQDTAIPHRIPMAARQAPELAGTYEIERELGHGGMGIVYLARQKSLNRQVALKVLRPGERTFGSLLRRFLEEAQHLAKLRHPHIVAIHEVGEAAGEPYFTMDYIDGQSLASVLRRGPLTPTRAVEILKQVAAAVQHAHRQGIVHRDLKPANVLIDQAGQAFVSDFGLARNLSQASDLTQSGELLGTPQYMSPEQARGQSSLIGEATDIHALGLLLFEMLTGRAAFGAPSPADVLVRLLHEEPVRLRSIDRRIPRDLETICLKALQKSPAMRYANVSALLEDIRRFEAGLPLLAKRTGPLQRGIRWAGRRWKVGATILGTAVLVAAATPMLLDKSVDELIAWGEEELSAGRPVVAAQVWQRAMQHGTDAQREMAGPRFADAIRRIDDPQQAVEMALQVIPLAPELSFGPYDYLVAQALVLEARGETPHGVFEPLHDPIASEGELSQRTIAAKRLSIFLHGAEGTAEQRREAEESLRAIEHSLQKLRPLRDWATDSLVQLPAGSLDELARQSRDRSRSPWDRGRAAMAMGRLYEADNRLDEAQAAYRASLSQLKKVYPFHGGVISDHQFSTSTDEGASAAMDAPECRLVRELTETLRRLDPEALPATIGGLRLRFSNAENLAGIPTTLRMILCDPEIDDPNQGLSRNLSTNVPIALDQPSEVRVIPGTYRLAFGGTSMKWDPVGEADPRLVDLRAEDWPTEIEVGEQWIDLPPIQVRRLSEITLIHPEKDHRFDPGREQLRWTAVPGATRYEVQLASYSDVPTPTVNYFTTATVADPSLRPAALSPREQTLVRRHWTAGSTAGYRVQAFDAEGRPLAKSLQEIRFLVLAPLAEIFRAE